jgi:hypothetical protein
MANRLVNTFRLMHPPCIVWVINTALTYETNRRVVQCCSQPCRFSELPRTLSRSRTMTLRVDLRSDAQSKSSTAPLV